MNGPEPESVAPSLVAPVQRSGTRRKSPSVGSELAALGRLLYTHNPFYVASAWMVFSGLTASFSVRAGAFDAWSLTVSLAAYTLLLSVTALLVIRLGKVWDDARSLLLLIVLMFLGISVSFDGILASTPDLALRYYLLGWLFSATTSEALLRSLRLKLRWLFRLPFHLLLALFFVYPLLLAPRLGDPRDPVLMWELFGFSTIAALIFLALVPAVRRGPAYVRGNGSPWPWPWFPWVLFGMLALCISLRAYYLCLSLHFVGAFSSIFAPYFLLPLGLAAIVVLLESGLTSASSRVVGWAMQAPLGLVLLAVISRPHDPMYRAFLAQFHETLGAGPLVLTLWLMAAFYLFAAVRSAANANFLLTGTLAILSFAMAQTAPSPSNGLHPLPLLIAGTWQVGIGLRRRSSGDLVVGAGLWVVSAAFAGQGIVFDSWHGIVPVHSLLAIFLAAGYWYRDRTGRYARIAAATFGFALASVVALGNETVFPGLPDWAYVLYPLAMSALLVGYGYITAHRWCYAAAAGSILVCTVSLATRAYFDALERVIGLNQLTWGAIFFLLAATISLLKSGLPHRLLTRNPP
jgi:hypothetical protein